ncbi:murein biosynthesis integral membrane protein MurJ [Candidatus Parcubacteria bacterium]|nr:murein biosynthesis integral membrane protein MurJ [Candidatus Parcubacteria bacterium]
MTWWQKVVNGTRVEAETITGAAVLIAGFGLASRVLGLVRDRILAGMFGASGLDVYYAAFQVPDLLYSLLVVGAISTAFIPVFAGYFERDTREAWRVASGVFSLFAIVFSVLAVLAIFFAPAFMRFVVPGFSPERRAVAIDLTRIMFLSPVFFGLANVLASALQYFRRFFLVSVAPLLYNLGIIFGAVVLTPVLGPAGLAWGVVLGAISFFVLHLVGVAGMGFRFLDLASMFHVGVRTIIVQALPRTVGLALTQIVAVVMAVIASSFAAGSIGVYNLALNLQGVPIGLVGVAFASAAFPKLSRAWAEGNGATFRATLSHTLREILFFLVPFAALLIILRAQVVRVFYGFGKFGWVDTRLTAAALGLFAISIVAQGVIPYPWGSELQRWR